MVCPVNLYSLLHFSSHSLNSSALELLFGYFYNLNLLGKEFLLYINFISEFIELPEFPVAL